MAIEYRQSDEIVTDNSQRKITGYAARFNADSLPMMHRGEMVIERIAPGAFRDTLENPDVSMYMQHDDSEPLASTLSGTLNLREDDDGLAFEANLPDTQLARDAITLLRAGLVRQMSFGFNVVKDDVSQGVRTLRAVDLAEISLVERAAYPQASADARKLKKKVVTVTTLKLRNYKEKHS